MGLRGSKAAALFTSLYSKEARQMPRNNLKFGVCGSWLGLVTDVIGTKPMQRHTAASRSARPAMRLQQGVFCGVPTTRCTKSFNKSPHTPSLRVSLGQALGGLGSSGFLGGWGWEVGFGEEVLGLGLELKEVVLGMELEQGEGRSQGGCLGAELGRLFGVRGESGEVVLDGVGVWGPELGRLFGVAGVRGIASGGRTQ
ncbi:PREDICTED: putative lipid-binding [Prunus dulcis]|uniref:PREDICTED: putative lipid-binding n=1 Tax=Prunus dulcis TaxID=3755 RepID=A0A5E4FRW3_PRUDU|nr:PREDICTED: putative lipid-binding [Prunus dulcis]